MFRSRFAAAALLATLATASVSLPGFAQANAAAAEALFDQARSAMDEEEYDEACAKFRESHRLDPAPGTLLNLANCEELRGKLSTAWELFRAASAELPAGDDRIAVATERAAKLKPRIPRLEVVLEPGSPKGTVVKRGELTLGAASLGTPLPVDPGTIEVVVSAPGKPSKTFSVTLAEGEYKTLEVSLGSGAGGGGEEAASGGGGQRTLGLALGGVGIAGLVFGSVTGVMALGKKSTVDSECDAGSKFCTAAGADAASSGSTLSTLSTVGWVVGAVGLGAGAYFFFTASAEGSQTGVHAGLTPHGSALSFLHKW